MSRKTSRIARSSKPVHRGEPASRPQGGLLPPLSVFVACLAAALAPARASGVPAVLAGVVAELEAAAGCDSFRVSWSGALEKELARLDQASAVMDRGAGLGSAPSGAAPPARTLIHVRGKLDGRMVEWQLFAEPQCFGEYYAAPRALRSGAVLGREDLLLLSGWHPVDALTPRDALEAMLFVPAGLASGAAIRARDLKSAPFVRRATAVSICYSAPGISLKGRGLVRADGWLGDRVKVRMEGALRDCEADVTAPGEVTVRPAQQAARQEGSTR